MSFNRHNQHAWRVLGRGGVARTVLSGWPTTRLTEATNCVSIFSADPVSSTSPPGSKVLAILIKPPPFFWLTYTWRTHACQPFTAGKSAQVLIGKYGGNSKKTYTKGSSFSYIWYVVGGQRVVLMRREPFSTVSGNPSTRAETNQLEEHQAQHTRGKVTKGNTQSETPSRCLNRPYTR